MRVLFSASLFVFLSCAAFAQTAPAPTFEVASVKLSAMRAGSWCRFLPGGRLSATSWIRQVIQIAYGVADYQVTGGPGWLGTDRYDIEAKAGDPGAGQAEMTVMLQSLLADRFQLKLRRETRTFDAYDLVAAKNGPKLTPLEDGGKSRCGPDNSFVCGVRTMDQLANALKYSAGRPVFNKTGVAGNYDVLLDFDTYAATGQTPPPGWDKPSLAAALQEQLGLKLEPQKASLPLLVVESIERPTQN